MSLKNKKIIVGITGGIAAYKTVYLIRLLKQSGAEVRTIMTSSSTKFITLLTIETVSQNPIACEMFPDRYASTHHIDLAEWADLFVIAPATANCIGKIASGICDDLLSTVICAAQAPIMLAPAMNTTMYLNPITQNNIEYLKSLDYLFVGPGSGDLACETTGVGRMSEPEKIFSEIESFFSKKKLKNQNKSDLFLKNKKVIVTAGPCREDIDPVRYISNRSSGKMGFALAEAAKEAGAEVTLISGPVNLEADADINLVKVESTEQMYKAVKKHFKTAHYLIMAAAPADFKAKLISKEKIKKGKENKGSLPLELSATIDILSSLSQVKKANQKVIGSALETENGVKNAKAKLKAKKLDLIILNSIEEATPFDNDSNRVIIINKQGRQVPLPRMDKKELAIELIKRIAKVK